MKMPKNPFKFEFTPDKFYRFGMACFIIIGCANFTGYFINFNLLPWYFKVGNFFSSAFNFGLAYLFHYLYKQTKPQPNVEIPKPLTEEEVKAFMGEEESKTEITKEQELTAYRGHSDPKVITKYNYYANL